MNKGKEKDAKEIFGEEIVLEPRFFKGEELHFFHPAPRTPLRVTIAKERSLLEAEVVRCFPISDPKHFIEVRERGGKPAGIIRDMAGMNSEQGRIVETALNQRYILPRILKILVLDDRYHYFYALVETDRGRREFRIGPPRLSVRHCGLGRFEIKDQTGCRYEISDIERLDSESQDLFEQVR